MKLQETFSSPESRVPRAVMFIDLANSTEMKESHTEATWLTTLGWFYDLIATKVGSEYGGNIIKYTGDGAMIIFDTDHVAEAINAAIALQEAIREARHNHEVDCYATIGIATGRTVRFRHFQGQEDYVDAVVDLAARLCSAASSQAILVDTDTITHANMGKVVSQIGRLSSPPRSAQQYAGDAHTFEAKGFKNLVKYNQIFGQITRMDSNLNSWKTIYVVRCLKHRLRTILHLRLLLGPHPWTNIYKKSHLYGSVVRDRKL